MKDRSKTMLQNLIKNYPELSEVKSSAEAALSLLIEELKMVTGSLFVEMEEVLPIVVT